MCIIVLLICYNNLSDYSFQIVFVLYICCTILQLSCCYLQLHDNEMSLFVHGCNHVTTCSCSKQHADITHMVVLNYYTIIVLYYCNLVVHIQAGVLL